MIVATAGHVDHGKTVFIRVYRAVAHGEHNGAIGVEAAIGSGARIGAVLIAGPYILGA